MGFPKDMEKEEKKWKKYHLFYFFFALDFGGREKRAEIFRNFLFISSFSFGFQFPEYDGLSPVRTNTIISDPSFSPFFSAAGIFCAKGEYVN